MKKQSSHFQMTVLIVTCLVSILALSGYLTQVRTASPYIALTDPVFEQSLLKAKQTGKDGDWSHAHALLSQHAKTNNPQAKLEYALLHLKGWGIKRNLETARLLLLQAVQYEFPGRGQAAFELGKVYRFSNGPDCPRIAFEWFSKALAWGFVKAHNELGKAFARGLGVPADYDLALKHYGLAIENGSVSAVVPLFKTALQQQKDGNADPARGAVLANRYLPLLEAEANGGDRIAARALGRIHGRGLFVKSNGERAMKWFALAASQGDAVAMHDLAMFGLSQNKKSIDLKEAIALLTDSAELGYPAAMTALGRIYISKPEVSNVSKAIAHLKRGAQSGHAGSMAELAKLHYEGKLVPKDIRQAKIFAEQGALQKHLGCRKLLIKIARYEKENGPVETTNTQTRKG